MVEENEQASKLDTKVDPNVLEPKTSDTVVEDRYLEDKYNARILYKEQINPDLVILRVTLLSPIEFTFVPGQFAELGFFLPEKPDKVERRSYSISSSCLEQGYLEFLIVKVQDGCISPKILQLQVGDKIWINDKIKGKFTLDNAPEKQNIIMVATGTGLAPFVSMLKSYQANPSWNHLTIVHGVRHVHDLAYKQELEDFSNRHSNFTYIPTVTREPENSTWNGLKGRINRIFTEGIYQEITTLPLDPSNTHLFLCGNPEMINSLQEDLAPLGFKPHKKKDPGNVHFERYW